RAFDRVWSQDAFLHSGDRNRVLEEARRVLRGGGRLVFTDPMAADGVRRDLLSPILRRLQLDSMASPSYYRSQLTRLGARTVDFEDLTPHLPTHYQRVLDEPVRREAELREQRVSEENLDRKKVGLRHWVD